MCSSHQPTAGADSETVRKPYIALIEEYDGGRVKLRVTAIGPNDAKHQARESALDKGYDISAVLRVTEDDAERAYADAELQRVKDGAL